MIARRVSFASVMLLFSFAIAEVRGPVFAGNGARMRGTPFQRRRERSIPKPSSARR